MSNLSMFMKENKKKRENAFYAATKSLTDENGEALLWEIRPLTTAEDERIRQDCAKEVAVPGKRDAYRTKTDVNLYLLKQIVTSVVSPNLYSAELQDSYGVKTPEELVQEIVDNPLEFAALGSFIRNYSGFDISLEEKVEAAKN